MHDAWAKRRTRNLVVIDVLLLAASVVGILSQIAKDHPSTVRRNRVGGIGRRLRSSGRRTSRLDCRVAGPSRSTRQELSFGPSVRDGPSASTPGTCEQPPNAARTPLPSRDPNRGGEIRTRDLWSPR